MPPKVSIIIPIYNAAATLQTAVRSILTQNVEPLEVLLIDDGSTDATPEICHLLAAQDCRVQVITQKNTGICAARNRGLQAADGEYIGFCDDDDIMLPGALERLLQTAEERGADVVRGDYELLRTDGETTHLLAHDAGNAYDLAAQGDYGAYLRSSGPQFVWNALYRRSALAGLFFDERCRYGLEDFIFNAELYARTERCIYLPQPVYRHFETVQSTSLCRTAQALRGRIRVLELWLAAEYRAVQARCLPGQSGTVWNDRCAQAVTFLMHQFAEGHPPAPLRRFGWRTLRSVLANYPAPPLTLLHGAGQNKKQTAALLLYRLHLQDVYRLRALFP